MSRVYDTEIRRQENDGTQIEKRKKKMLKSLWQCSLLTIYSGILYENFNYCAMHEI